MAKSPRELLGMTGDRLHDAAGFIGHLVDITWEQIDSIASKPVDKLYAGALLVQDMVLRPQADVNNEDERIR